MAAMFRPPVRQLAMNVKSFLVPMIDPGLVKSTLSSPPFVSAEGVFNMRDFGAACHVAGSPTRIRPRMLYRAGELSHITERGVEQLRALGVRTVFDLRTDDETARYKTAPRAIDGLKIVRLPITEHVGSPKDVAHRLKDFEANELDAFLQAYARILQSNASSLERVLRHLRDRPDEPCIIHCTAGKDRTGVFAAAILMLLGARDEDIIADYALTEVGLQPVVAMFAVRFQREAVFRENWTGTLNMGSARPQSMRRFLDHVRQRHGGIEPFLTKHTSLRDVDFQRIRANLLV
ncbi:hypothetical protein BN946_scf184843.g26 [Trametes cinnabarina]|uniref:Tyrosine specific protein phosphatases domain-containing protein n=1 Tax=Pycnoporus cinnabarinus TaxID=5643 RepID=A0A060S7A1_PYCCI|nr:hypothetical protein BN946_scf184843.g26 [Trametes cinnabarina]